MKKFLLTFLAASLPILVQANGISENFDDALSSSSSSSSSHHRTIIANYFTHIVTTVAAGEIIPFDHIQVEKGFRLRNDGAIVVNKNVEGRLFDIEFYVEIAQDTSSSTIELEVNGNRIPASRHTEFPGAENAAQVVTFLKGGDVVKVINAGTGSLSTTNVGDVHNTTASIIINPVH